MPLTLKYDDMLLCFFLLDRKQNLIFTCLAPAIAIDPAHKIPKKKKKDSVIDLPQTAIVHGIEHVLLANFLMSWYKRISGRFFQTETVHESDDVEVHFPSNFYSIFYNNILPTTPRFIYNLLVFI